MSIEKKLGGDRLGTGNQMKVRLHNYERSTHDLGKVVRTTMTSGTLNPLYTEVVLKGDTWDMDLTSLVRTWPTNGPVYGSWKMQADVFTFDTRLYNKQLHNNLTGVGMNMKNIIFPQMRLNGKNPNWENGDLNQQQVSQSSLLAYLGVRGLGTKSIPNGEGRVEIMRNAMPLMGYMDIYKQYYTNKQEEIGYCITQEASLEELIIIEEAMGFLIVPGSGNLEIWLTNMPEEQQFEAGIRIAPLSAGEKVTIRGRGLEPENIRVWGDINDDISTAQEWSLAAFFQTTEFTVTETGIEFINGRTGGALYGYETPTNGYPIYSGIRLIETATHTASQLKLQEFPLSNIDDMREAVFMQPKTSPLIIGYEGEEARGYPYDAVVGQVTVGEGEEAETNMGSFFTMAGLCLKTYQSDRYNNWLLTDWIDQISSISAVDTSSGSFTIDSLNLQQKMYKLLNRVAVSGATVDDWYEAVYGEKAHGAAEMPVYRGGMSAEITFDEVISSSEATTVDGWSQPLGTLGGRGIQKMVKGGNIHFRAEEHGYVMVIVSLTPRIDYSQGNKWWGKLETMDDYHKPQLDQIGFQELLTDEMAAWDTKVADDGTETFFSAGKQTPWIQYQTNTNENYGNFAIENSEMFMVLSRRYQNDENGRIEDLTTYIDPTKFNYPFAYIELDAMPFWVQIGIGAEVRRKMSAHQMPNL